MEEFRSNLDAIFQHRKSHFVDASRRELEITNALFQVRHLVESHDEKERSDLWKVVCNYRPWPESNKYKNVNCLYLAVQFNQSDNMIEQMLHPEANFNSCLTKSKLKDKNVCVRLFAKGRHDLLKKIIWEYDDGSALKFPFRCGVSETNLFQTIIGKLQWRLLEDFNGNPLNYKYNEGEPGLLYYQIFLIYHGIYNPKYLEAEDILYLLFHTTYMLGGGGAMNYAYKKALQINYLYDLSGNRWCLFLHSLLKGDPSKFYSVVTGGASGTSGPVGSQRLSMILIALFWSKRCFHIPLINPLELNSVYKAMLICGERPEVKLELKELQDSFVEALDSFVYGVACLSEFFYLPREIKLEIMTKNTSLFEGIPLMLLENALLKAEAGIPQNNRKSKMVVAIMSGKTCEEREIVYEELSDYCPEFIDREKREEYISRFSSLSAIDRETVRAELYK